MSISKKRLYSIGKKLLWVGFIIIMLSVILIVSMLIYLAIPVDEPIDYKTEIFKYEKELSNSMQDKTVLKKVVKELEQKTLSAECQNQIIDLKHASIEDAYEIYNEQGFLFSKDCQSEIRENQKSDYGNELDDACNYGRDVQTVIKLLAPADKSDMSAIYQEIKVGCEAGTLAYGSEMDQYLAANLKQIDQLSRYMYLKVLQTMDLSGGFANNAIQKPPVIETLIKKTNRFVFIMHTLKEIHKENKMVDELSFKRSPLRHELLKMTYDFGRN